MTARTFVVGASGEVGREVMHAWGARGGSVRALVDGDLGVRASIVRSMVATSLCSCPRHHAREEI